MLTPPLFLQDITCLTRIRVILKQQGASSKINISKSQALLAYLILFYIKRIDKTGQIVWSQFSIKIFGVHFGKSVLVNSNLDKIRQSLTKKINISNRVQLSLG